MALSALRGAFGFLTRIPVGHDERAWTAFRESPVTFPLAGYAIGGLAGLALFVPAPDPTVAAIYVAWLYLLTGITHIDGLADLGDALVVHGSAETRREVLKDTTVGVGAVVAVAVLVTSLASAAVSLAVDPRAGLGLVIAAEVSAKLGMSTLVCVGTATHEGMAATLTAESSPRDLVLPTVVALPAAAATWPHPAAGVSLVTGLVSVTVVFRVARRRLGGVNGDVFGAANEIARVVALHAGVIAWTQL
ncbi:adenosylcobinamide-GDP ribazoletransferase [Halovenus salina]|uniref:Adenosylcobinamide-GDP ribazoletransferase n=1 Tax=Halovenus salina TaxID=1510225 RepID=A0ABD5VVZ4_9EURY|nr:adenosylcobinamide-GDP ribazoletransferase [Halovenus salina]